MKLNACVLVLCCVIVSTLSTKVVLKDNGYDNVVIALDDKLPVSMCQDILQGLESTVRSASSVIFKASRNRASFRTVNVVLPSSWTPAQCPPLMMRGPHLPSAKGESWETADVKIWGQRHPMYGAYPWTLQSQGCGHPGDYISLGHDFLLKDNSTNNNGRLLAQQWLKYRYGVFEETGELGNIIHPPHYRGSDSSFHPTSCSNVPLQEGPTKCQPEDLSCEAEILASENPALTSSLLAHPHIHQVEELCDEGTHNHEAPTRHNLICNGKSIWEVMRANPDFQDNRNIEGALRENDVVFKYLRSESPKIVLLIDDTNVMNVQKRWDFMRKAVRKLVMFDVPDGFSVGLIVYDSMASVKHPLTELSDNAVREKVAASLPRNPSNVGEDRRCIKCGLVEALNQLKQNGGTQGGHIILVSPDSGKFREDSQDSALLVKSSGVTLHAIIYPVTGPFPTTGSSVERLAASTGGRTFSISDEGIGADSKLVMYYNLLDAMYFTLESTAGEHVLPVKVHAAEHIGGRSQSEGSFLVDQSLGANTVFTIFYYDIAHVGDIIQLESPNNQLIDTTNMQKEDANINMISVRLDETQVIPGLWRYKVENRADSHQALFVQVTSRPRSRLSSDKLTVRSWTSHKNREVNATDISRPLAIFTEIRSGVAAVESATVTAVISRLGLTNNGSQYKEFQVELHDDGLLSPDMNRGDGVFSRLIPGLEPGKYKVVIKVTGKVGGNKFARHERLGVIDVIGHLHDQDVISPARIVDFRALILPNSNSQVTFTWTAPGGDYDYGMAERYVVRTSTHRLDVIDNSAKLLEGWPKPMKAGTIQTHTITWMDVDKVHYVGLYAVDKSGNTAMLSNIIPVYVPAPPTTTSHPSLSYSSVPSVNASAVTNGARSPVLATLDTNQLAVVFSCIGVFIIIMIIIICCCIASYKRNKKAAAAKKVQEIQNGYNVTVTVGSKPDFVQDKDQIKDGLKKEYLSPVESWSASQLLSNHHDNKRGSVSGRSDNNSDHSGSTKKSYGGSSGPVDLYNNHNQYPYPAFPEHYPAPSDGYPTPTESYPSEGGYPVPSEARSYISSQPSDSFLSVSCDLIPSTHGPPGYSAYPHFDGSLRSTKVPPPIPPKPKVLYTPEPYMYDAHEGTDGSSSTPSVASEKRIRNVTMV